MTPPTGPTHLNAGLYDPTTEHDACGVAFVADLSGRRTHSTASHALEALINLEHRGAVGSDPHTGDGAGILLQVPDELLRAEVDFHLPAPGSYAAGIAFLPADRAEAEALRHKLASIVAAEQLDLLGWREVPVDPSGLGADARASMPRPEQLVVAGHDGSSGIALDRLAYAVRKRAERELGLYFPSLSARTMVYKGMLTPPQLARFYPDLADPRLATALALVHSRFSTNTFPSWELAHPYRYIAHNGEINTIRGNRNRMRAREALINTGVFGPDVARLFPITADAGSDSRSFDDVLELLHLAGRSLPHAVLMMIPEAWEANPGLADELAGFYRFHASLMEPWDGPACITFTDGTIIGAMLDRNGLRPGRYWVTDDGLVVLASEVGVLDLDPATIVAKGRLQPGKMFLVDTAAGRIVTDAEIKHELAAAHPYSEWVHAGVISLDDLPARGHEPVDHDTCLVRQQVFGYTSEEMRVLIAPMARTGAEPIGAMGDDTPIAVLSRRPRLFFDYFTQLFAQVTNPPLDAIRESMVTSLARSIGPEGNLLDPGPASCRQILLPFPVISDDELAKIIHINDDGDLPGFASAIIDGRFDTAPGGLAAALDRVRSDVSVAIERGARIIILSDRGVDKTHAPIPSLLLTGAVHHHLVRTRARTRVGLIVEAGDARDVHHVATLLGYGAAAVNPYVAMEAIEDLVRAGDLGDLTAKAAIDNYIHALGKGVQKVMSKMGVSTVASYTAAQLFEALGLSPELIDEAFTGTSSRLGGIGLAQVADEVIRRHRLAFPDRLASGSLAPGGFYSWRRDGEDHQFDPDSIALLQQAVRSDDYEVYQRFAERIDDQSARLMTLRGLLELHSDRSPIPLDEVEPIEAIVTRFATGAMSYGSISAEAHETIAIAMNRLGARSNSGEGGEDPERDLPLPNGDSRRSRVRQVASGRFGVTSGYLVAADDIQIKIAQGAKPGEGGQLPGSKVYPWIARTRHSTPGVGLISPPPHHDIYSIEDLAQLIFDLHNANDRARVHVKLVAELGVGTVAAGVAKARADVVLISGQDGGTGAAPLNSIKHAGIPWEIGLAETQVVLQRNGLRDRITVQVDGGLKTGRDVVVAALLGAEEYGFATAPLVATGCVMMRVCHLDTCPVGVATQNPELRKRFIGRPEDVVNYFTFVARQVREMLASLGYASLDELIGRRDLLEARAAIDHWKTDGLDLSPLLADGPGARRRLAAPDHGLAGALDYRLIAAAADALTEQRPISLEYAIRNTDRTCGTMLGAEVTRRFGERGLPADTITVNLTGSAGQSLGAFLPPGITLRLCGDANDYVGKGLSGGTIVLVPPPQSPFPAESTIIAGNVILYGATAGRLYARGVVGERFAVRNSGAIAVVEGVGDHGCEYMTGGRVVVLGPTGRNFAAGMSGGIAYILDLDPGKVNRELVGLSPLDQSDQAFLLELLTDYAERTGSARAADLLAWPATFMPRITKVIPHEYAAYLARQAKPGDGDRATAELEGANHG